LHIYLNDGNTELLAEKIRSFDRILEVSIHLGNSDIVARYACRDAQDLLGIIAEVKRLAGVMKVVWSEQVSSLGPTKGNMAMLIGKLARKTT